jgi:hypothetical protein
MLNVLKIIYTLYGISKEAPVPICSTVLHRSHTCKERQLGINLRRTYLKNAMLAYFPSYTVSNMPPWHSIWGYIMQYKTKIGKYINT